MSRCPRTRTASSSSPAKPRRWRTRGAGTSTSTTGNSLRPPPPPLAPGRAGPPPAQRLAARLLFFFLTYVFVDDSRFALLCSRRQGHVPRRGLLPDSLRLCFVLLQRLQKLHEGVWEPRQWLRPVRRPHTPDACTGIHVAAPGNSCFLGRPRARAPWPAAAAREAYARGGLSRANLSEQAKCTRHMDEYTEYMVQEGRRCARAHRTGHHR